ncbi:MAG: bis(5'-nucleosyl)-tetraphosphatase (symmetrical) YqeK [Candidatus Margulisbacteria bacterium]|nr:bis(5'-nucleosyl)-tetraphosphatase (symmetrical) YqeK [Candidatus Margulisiibacteriota bacterium]
MLARAVILAKLKQVLDPERFEHSLRVEASALKLAEKHHVPAGKVSLAALLHDYARQYSRQELLEQAKKYRLAIDPVAEFEPKLLHAELSALLAKKDFQVSDKAILEAIKKHTLGSPGMSKLEKIIYLADHIEEGRDFAGVKRVRQLAVKDLDRAIAESAGQMLKYLLAKGLPIHPLTVQTRNYYLIRS